MFNLENILQSLPRPCLTDTELEILLDGTANSRYGKVKRLLSKGRLIHIRRGLYGLPNSQRHKIHPFELAQYIYSPSYISLESALSFYQLIPESVYTTTSVTTKRTKEFKTSLGVFSYQHLPTENFYAEVKLIKDNDRSYFIATPWKAICDYVFCYRKNWHDAEPLFNSLRIDRENLPELTFETAELLNDYYHQRRITRFLQGVQKINFRN